MSLYRYIEYKLLRLPSCKTPTCTRFVFPSFPYSLSPTTNLLRLISIPRLSRCDRHFRLSSPVFVIGFTLPTCIQYTSLQLWFCYFIVQVLNLSNYLQFPNLPMVCDISEHFWFMCYIFLRSYNYQILYHRIASCSFYFAFCL